MALDQGHGHSDKRERERERGRRGGINLEESTIIKLYENIQFLSQRVDGNLTDFHAH